MRMAIFLNIEPIEVERIRRGWDKQTLAKEAGITREMLSGIYGAARSFRFPNPPRVKKVVDVLGLRMVDVMIEVKPRPTLRELEQLEAQADPTTPSGTD